MSAERRIFGSESENVARAEPREGQTDKKIVPGMREDARAKTAAVESEQTEEHAEGGEQDHAARALIPMRAAEDHGGGEHAHSDAAARPGGELALQVTAKDNLLDETDQKTE